MDKRRKTTLLAIALLAGALVLHIPGGVLQSIVSPLLCLIVLVLLFLQLRSVRRRYPVAEETIPAGPVQTMARTVEKQIGTQTGQLHPEVLGVQHRINRRVETEAIVDRILDDYIRLMRARLDAHTVAVFFPTDDGGYHIRRFWSESEHVNKDAVIHPGVGIIGSFLKDGLRHLNLQEIVTDSMTLYYYTRDAGIRSLMASPIVTDGADRGYIIVDSMEKKHFTDEDHAYLSTLASVLGQSVYYAYLYSEHKIKHERLSAMSNTEKDFFTHLTLDAVLDKIVEIVPFAIACDRLTISLAAGDGTSATIMRVKGEYTQGLLNKTFSIQEKTLASLVYTNDLCIFRNFAHDRYEYRYFAGEPEYTDYLSFMALPFGVQENKGVIFLESLRRDAFTDAHRDLLARLATSAGLAIEKLRSYERANTLATRDGLTGLMNHRQFQSQLKDEVVRALRYKEPLSLVLCDIDFFKKINDTYGHPFGDTVLKGVAATLRDSIRDTIDAAARYGGEEFALILVKTDLEHAKETAERIRQAVAGVIYRTGRGEEVHVSMSFGIAVFGLHAKESDALIKKADKALYAAKKNGRNRVEVVYLGEDQTPKNTETAGDAH